MPGQLSTCCRTWRHCEDLMSAPPTRHAAPWSPAGELAVAPADQAPDGRGFVAVVGPPAVGKSTVSGALAYRSGARVFRLREFAHEFGSRPGVDEHRFATCDPLGWFGDETVAVLLQAAFLRGQFPARGLVVLENFPGAVAQLRLLQAIAGELRAPVAVIELTAPDSVVATRARARRVCLTCEPDPRGDPHRPASPSAHAPDQCGHCGGWLRRRLGDHSPLFVARLQRFRSRIPAIRREAAALRLPYQVVDASGDAGTCREHATAALAAVDAFVHLLTPRHEHV